MRKSLLLLLLTFFVVGSTSVLATDWTKDHMEAYQAAISKHFQVSPEAISGFIDRGVAAEDLPVICLLAERAGVEPDKISNDRADGASWMSIAEDHGLKADVFYILFGSSFSSTTYSPILEKYQSVPQTQWANMQLSDEEIVNMVNLKFISSFHDYSMFEIMAMRDYGKTFLRINHQVQVAKKEMLTKEKKKQKKAKKDN